MVLWGNISPLLPYETTKFYEVRFANLIILLFNKSPFLPVILDLFN